MKSFVPIHKTRECPTWGSILSAANMLESSYSHALAWPHKAMVTEELIGEKLFHFH